MKKFKTDLIHFGYLNKNKRLYQEENIDLDYLNSQTIFGEIGHPSRFEVSLQNVSHKIDNFKIERGILYGDVEILSTPKGYILEELYRNNSIVFRPRGSGEILSDGTIVDYHIYTFDAVDVDKDSFENCKLRRKKIERIKSKIRNI